MASCLRLVRADLLKRAAVMVMRSQKMCSSELDKPVKFSVSKAATWKAEFSRRGESVNPEETTWFEPYVVIGSVACFLIYFCVLREENDIDLALDVNLYNRIDGLEELQLRTVLKYNQENGIPTGHIEARLVELEKESAMEKQKEIERGNG